MGLDDEELPDDPEDDDNEDGDEEIEDIEEQDVDIRGDKGERKKGKFKNTKDMLKDQFGPNFKMSDDFERQMNMQDMMGNMGGKAG